MRFALVLLAAVFAAPGHGADQAPPDWLAARTDSLIAARPADPALQTAWPDTLLALAAELAGRGFAREAAAAMGQAGVRAFRQSDLDRAVSIWQDGLAYAREHDERESEADLLNALAVGYTVSDRIDEAIATYARSLALKAALGDSLGISRTWANLATTYNQVGRLAEGLAAMAEAERWNALTGNVEGEIAAAVNRAGILNRLGRHSEALDLADRVLRRLADETVPAVLDARGLAHLQRTEALVGLGRPAAALAAADLAVAACEAAGADYYRQFGLEWRVDALRRLERPAEARAALADFARAVEAGDVDRLRIMQHLYTGLLQLDAGQADSARVTLAKAVTAFEERRAAQLADATRTGIFGIAGDVYGALAHARLATGDTLGAWRVTERGHAALFRERAAAGDDVADLAAVQAALAEADAVLLQACETQAEPLVWFVVTPTSLAAVTAGDPGDLAADARAALALLAAGADETVCTPVLGRLGLALLAPLAPWLGDTGTRLYVVPPSPLAGFPLAVLPRPDGHRLGDVATLDQVPSATALVLLTGRLAHGRGLLAMADPEIGAGPVADSLLPADPLRQAAATPLPEARREVAHVAGPDATVRVGTGATLGAFLAGARDAAVIHLATHAVSDPVDGRRSAVLLAADPPAAGPAVLTAAAAETLRLAADLAVLSGCRSGLGHAVLGEGSFGLPRSLLLAGCRTVVSSLWDVEDTAARQFMEVFYDVLRDGRARDVALQEAARTLAAGGAPPRDWAAFVLAGVGHEPVPALATAPPRRSHDLAIWAAALVVMLAGAVALARRLARRSPHRR